MSLLSRIVGLAVTAVLAHPAPAAAQQADNAIIVGTVLDESRAPIPGAPVTVTHIATGVSTPVVTNQLGQYRTPPIRIGVYDVSVELEGFRRFVQTQIVLSIGDVRNVDVVLAVGALTDTVTVKADATLLNTSDSTVGTVITNKQIGALPLNGRDYLQLASLSAGTGAQASQGVVIGGQSGTAAAFLLDGHDNNNQQISTGHSGQKEVVKPSVDAIEEFKVVTNGYSAEFGRSSSGVISVSLKSGTNTLHGSAFEYFRDDRFDEKDYFAATKADYNRHQFGGAVGGPILRNRTFFFGDVEHSRIRRQTTTVSTLPTSAARLGQFSRTITDPLTRQPFANNVIPADRIDPAAARVLGYIPAAQSEARADNFVYNSPSDQDTNKWDLRVDHTISPAQSVYFRASAQRYDIAASSPLPQDAAGNYVSGGGGELSDHRSVVFVHNRVWSPSLISSARVGWNKITWDETVPDQALRGLGLPGVDSTQPGFSQIAITGYRSFGVSNVPNSDDSTTAQVSADVTWNRGAHTVKTGVQAYRLSIDFLSSQRSSGIFNFNGQYTGDAFADFLLGYASSASLSKWATLNVDAPFTHVFVQDDWRVSRRLTLNLGLRYEVNLPPVDEHDAIANFDLDTDPANPRIVLAGEEGDDRRGRSTQGINRGLFAPRAGFAYSLPDGKTVIRGGAGLFYGNLITVGGMSSLEINPPNHLRIARTTDRTVPSIVLSQGFGANPLVASNARDVNLVSWDRSDRWPTATQWNLNLQRELPAQFVVEVGVQGNDLEHNWRSIDGNPAPAGPGNINSRRLYRSTIVPGSSDVVTLSNITRLEKDGWFHYRALQTKLEKRFGHGLSALAAYAWSRTRSLEGGYQDYDNQAAEVGPASTDRTHHFVASGVYQLPFGRDRRFGREWRGWVEAAFGGWSVSPIVTLTSGAPLDLTVNGNPSNSNGTDRPNVVGDWELDDPTVERWFNTAAFVANAPFTFGDAPKNLLRGPGYANLDIVVRKSFRVSSRVTADLRFESFNATNRVNFGNPNTQLGNPSFGRVSSAGSPRNNQVAVKLQF
jgi:hypothetical protein